MARAGEGGTTITLLRINHQISTVQQCTVGSGPGKPGNSWIIYHNISLFGNIILMRSAPPPPEGGEGEGGGKKGIIVKMLNLFLACIMQSLLPLLRC